jgi:hypothetical protein
MTLCPHPSRLRRTLNSTLISLTVGALLLVGQIAPAQAAPIRSAAATKIACPYTAEEFSNALSYDFEATDTGSSETPGVASVNCSFATADYEFVVSVSVSRWAAKTRFAREWKTAVAGYGAIVGSPLVPIAGSKDNAKVAANEQGKVQVALSYTSGTSLVVVTLSSKPSAAKAVNFKPEMVKLRRKKL